MARELDHLDRAALAAEFAAFHRGMAAVRRCVARSAVAAPAMRTVILKDIDNLIAFAGGSGGKK